MVAVLAGITLIASASVGAVYQITKEPIAQAKVQATTDALMNVLPVFDNSETTQLTIDEMPIVVYTAKAADGAVIGYAVESMTKSGFSGVIRLMVGFLPSGEIYNVNVLEQKETPGLGTKMCDEGNPLLMSVKGKNPAELKMSVKKDGGDIDALTAATISSRAYADAVNRAYAAMSEVAGGTKVDTASGATATAEYSESQQTQEGEQNE